MQIENQNSDRPCAKNEKKKTRSGLIFKLHGRHTRLTFRRRPKKWSEIFSGIVFKFHTPMFSQYLSFKSLIYSRKSLFVFFHSPVFLCEFFKKQLQAWTVVGKKSTYLKKWGFNLYESIKQRLSLKKFNQEPIMLTSWWCAQNVHKQIRNQKGWIY